MAVSCDPNDLAKAAKCFCADHKTQEEVNVYLLCQYANAGPPPPAGNNRVVGDGNTRVWSAGNNRIWS